MQQQLNLFDIETTKKYGVKVETAKPLESSGLNENQLLFVGALRKSPIPLTAQEVAERAVEIDDETKIRQVFAKRESVRKRARELVDCGWVKVCESRECRVTGQSANTYEVVR